MQKRLSTSIVATVIFMAAVAGMQYTQPMIPGNLLFLTYVAEVLMFMCILGAMNISFVSALVVCFVSPLIMFFFSDVSLVPAIVLIFANVLVVLFLLIFKKNMILGLACGITARFALAFCVCKLILVNVMGSETALGYGIIDKVNFSMLITSLIGGTLYYLGEWLGEKSARKETE